MDSTVIQTADALTTAINQIDWPDGLMLAATRAYRVENSPSGLVEPKLSVVPKGFKKVLASRAQTQRDVLIDVGFQKKVAAAEGAAQLAELDSLMGLVELISEQIFKLRLTNPDAIATEVQNDPVYYPDHLEHSSVFTSVLTFTFRLIG